MRPVSSLAALLESLLPEGEVMTLEAGGVGAAKHLSLAAQEGSLRARWRHLWRQGAAPWLTVVPAALLAARWMSEAEFEASCLKLTADPNAAVDREHLAAHLAATGYQEVSAVEAWGTYAVRGGVVDLFVPGDKAPVRLDFFGDELSELYSFDVLRQRRLDNLESLTVYPLRDVVFSREATARALGHLGALAEESHVPTRRLRAWESDIERQNFFFGIEAAWPLFCQATAPLHEALLLGASLIVDDGPAVRQAP